MLQKNSFFSQPLIFFGPHENNEEEEENNENAWLITDPWLISRSVPGVNPEMPNIGLFIHWADTSNSE